MPSKPSSRRSSSQAQTAEYKKAKAAASGSSRKRANILGTRPKLPPSPPPATVAPLVLSSSTGPLSTLSPVIPTSRLCVKNLPPTFTEEAIRSHFSSLSGSVLTDVCLKRTPDGLSRRLAFIGFRTREMAAEALRYFDKNFINTSRISVQFALERGNAALDRPWSKWSGDDRRKKELPAERTAVEEMKEKESSSVDRRQRKGKKEKRGLESLLSSALSPSRAASLSSDRLFSDYLHVMMGGKSHRKVWENDENADMAAKRQQPGGDAKESKGKEGEEEAERRRSLLEALDEDEDSGDEGFNNPETIDPTLREEKMSDVDYLKSRQRVTFDSDEEEEEGKEKERPQPSVAARSKGMEGDPAGATSAAATAEGELDDCRLFIRNLPFSVTEEDLRLHFSPFGSIESIHIPLTSDGKGKGFAFLSFVAAASASRALTALNDKIVLGRIIHIMQSQRRVSSVESSEGLTYKKKRELERKANAGRSDVSNGLFLRPDTVLASMADRLSVSKADILNVEADSSLAVRLALAETHLIAETKRWLAEQGVNVAALERREQGRDGTRGRADASRSTTVLLVKNLPYETDVAELRSTFGHYGNLRRVLMPPSRTLAIIEYDEPHQAKKGFMGLAYSKFHHTPLYLEWAPIDTLRRPPPTGVVTDSAVVPSPSSSALAAQSDADAVEGVTIFVKNLSFQTTEAGLLSAFSSHAAVRSVHIATKKNSAAAIAAGGPNTLSMGFGFVELRKMEDVLPTIQRVQGMQLDGHNLELKPSTKAASRGRSGSSSSASAPSRRLIVKNLPFEATAGEVRSLLSTFGSISRVRLPRKFDGGHRGFAFVDFVTAAEAAAAMEAVGSTHLYGRPLVLEWSEEKEEGGEDDAGEGKSGSGAEARIGRQREKIKRQYETSQTELPAHKKKKKERRVDHEMAGGYA